MYMEDVATSTISPQTSRKSVVLICCVAIAAIWLIISNPVSATHQSPPRIHAQVARTQTPIDTSTEVTGNPIAVTTCDKPSFTIAISIDRSGSVGSNWNTYLDNAEKLVTDLSNDIVISRGGTLNVILTAFSSSSQQVNSKDTNDEFIYSITDKTSQEQMESTIQNIHNTGGYTNWESALSNIRSIANSSFTGTEYGKHIDLAVMLTDGKPNRIADGSFVTGIQAANAALAVAQDLREGTNDRPQMSVKGVLIDTKKSANDPDDVTPEDAMKMVFGQVGQGYYLASDFADSLAQALKDLRDSIQTNEECNVTYVYPTLSITVTNPSITATEGDLPSAPFYLIVRNTSTHPLAVIHDIGVDFTYGNSIPETYRWHVGTLNPGESHTLELSLSVEMGQILPTNKVTFVAKGKFIESATIKVDPLNPNASDTPHAETAVNLAVKRWNLPA